MSRWAARAWNECWHKYACMGTRTWDACISHTQCSNIADKACKYSGLHFEVAMQAGTSKGGRALSRLFTRT